MRSSASADSAIAAGWRSVRGSAGSRSSSKGSACWRRRRRTLVAAAFAVMRYIQVENAASPRNFPIPRQARR